MTTPDPLEQLQAEGFAPRCKLVLHPRPGTLGAMLGMSVRCPHPGTHELKVRGCRCLSRPEELSDEQAQQAAFLFGLPVISMLVCDDHLAVIVDEENYPRLCVCGIYYAEPREYAPEIDGKRGY